MGAGTSGGGVAWCGGVVASRAWLGGGGRWTKEGSTGRRVVKEYLCRGDSPVDTIPCFRYFQLSFDLDDLHQLAADSD